jgi:HEAT repeat protein
MTKSLARPARLRRIFTIVAVVYGVLVAVAVWIGLPTQRQIQSDTAWNAIWAVQQQDEKYRTMPLRDIRRRLYRGLSDEQVIARVRDIAASEERRVAGNRGTATTSPEQLTLGLPGGEEARPKVAVLLEEIDQIHARRMAALESDQRKVITWGIVAWVIPAVLLYLFGPRLLRRRRTLRRF